MKSNKFLSSALYVFIFFIPLSSFLSVRLLLMLFIYSILAPGNRNIKIILANSWDIFLYLIMLIMGIIYTNDLSMGFKVLETNFCFLALPFVLNRANGSYQLDRIFKAFTLGLVAASLICLGNALREYFFKGNILAFFYYQLTEVIDLHPTYLAYYLILVITFGLYNLYYTEGDLPRWIVVILLVFFFVVLVLTGGSTAIVSLLLIFSFFILKYILEKHNTDKLITLIVIGIMLVSVFLINSSDYWIAQVTLKNDYWERTDLWYSAIQANRNPIFGVGTGGDKLVLNDFYRTHGLQQFATESLNAHNQFIQIYLSNGMIGLILAIIIILKPIYNAARNQAPLGVLVFFPFIVYGMNEVFLGRYQGIVFFALLSTVFTLYFRSAQDSKLLNPE